MERKMLNAKLKEFETPKLDIEPEKQVSLNT